MAAIVANTGSNNWNTNGAWVGGIQPTAADDVTIPATAIVTIPTAITAVCRSCTVSVSGELKGATTTSVLTIGDATAGAGNVAFSNAGTITNTGIWTINFISTSATVQTVTTGGQTMPNETYNAASNGSWQWSDNHTSSGTITLTKGTLDQNGKTWQASVFSSSGSNVRTLTPGAAAGTVTFAGEGLTMTTITNLTVTANTSTLAFTGAGASARCGGINLGGQSWSFSGGGAMKGNTGGAQPTIKSLTVTNTASQTDSFSMGAAGASPILGSGGTLTLTGNSAVNRLIVTSNVLGTPTTVTHNGSAVSITNVDFMDITTGGTFGTWTGTTIGDRLGNTGITVTTPATQTRDGTAGAAWSVAARWTSRVPLPQDNVVINGSSGSISATDVFCLGKDIDFTGYTGTLTHTSSATSYAFFGNFTLGAGMSFGAAANTFNVEARGRGSQTITSNGKQFFPTTSNQLFTIFAPGGTYQFVDSFNIQTSTASVKATLLVTNGTADLNGQSHTTGGLTSSGSATRGIMWSGATLNYYTTGAQTILSLASAGLTITGLATHNLTAASASDRTITSGGLSIGTVNYTVAASPGKLIFSDATSVTALNISANKSVQFASSTTSTISSWGTTTGVNNGYIVGAGDQYIASTPDTSALSITGDMDFRLRVSQTNITPGGSFRLAAKYNTTSNQRTWRFYNSSGSLTLDMSTTGADSSVATSSVTLASLGLVSGTTYWLRFTRVQSTGVVKFFYAADSASMPSSWTQIGTNQTATTSALFDSTTALTIGGDANNTNPQPGNYYRAQLRNNVLDDGTGIQFDADFTTKTFGANTFTEASSNAATVTMNGSGILGDGRIQITASTPASAATLSRASGIISTLDYMVIQDSTVTGGATWYAGAHSVNVSGNTGWIFTAAPAAASGNMMAMLA